MHRLRWEIISACLAAAVTIGVSVASSPVTKPSGADNTGAAISPPVIQGTDPAVQYTPSDLRRSFPELPRKHPQPRTPRRGATTRFAAMDLAPSAG